MLSENGFETVALGSFEVEVPLLPWIGHLAEQSPDRLARLLDPAVFGLEKVPILNLLGQHLVCVARKERALREASS